jgi:hypothetical protein
MREIPDPTRPDIWYALVDDDVPPAFTVRANVVRAPLTFGHTQVVLSELERELCEVERWELAFPHLKRIVAAMEATLRSGVHESEALAFAREYTATSGAFEKVIVLRTSATEGPTEFKLHLVPYFASHAEAARQRFEDAHSAARGRRGGLIGWLGDRETKIDQEI